jgi:phage baseplate assembly protein W
MSHPTTTWPLTTPAGPSIPAVGPTSPSAPASRPFTVLDHFGFGLTHPFRRDGKGDFANQAGPELVKSAVSQILGTFASSDISEGEVPWRPDFGSLLYLLRHQPNNLMLQELARVHVAEAIGFWEPRVRITDVRTSKLETDNTDDTLEIAVRFNFIDLNTGKVVFEDLESTIQI